MSSIIEYTCKVSVFKMVSKYLFQLFIVVIFFMIPVQVAAQSDCDPHADHVQMPIYVIDQAGQRWGEAGNTCGIPSARTPVGASKGGGTNYVEDLYWTCNSNSDRMTGGVFIARTFRCAPGYQPMVIDIQPPPGYECERWDYLGVSNGYGITNNNSYLNGNTCRISVPIPPYGNDGSRDVHRQVIMRIRPADPDPGGYCEAFNCNYFSGWTCDPTDFNDAIDVHFYADRVGDGQPASIIGAVNAGVFRQDLINAGVCGGTGNHGFVFNTPASLKDGNTYQISAYAIDVGGTNNPVLTNCPKPITCPAPTLPPTAPPACAAPAQTTNSGLTCTDDTTPELTVADHGVACYPHGVNLEIYTDFNNNNVTDGGDSRIQNFNVPGVLAANNDTQLFTSPTLSNGTYRWRSRAINAPSGSGATGPWSTWRDLDIDISAPPVPNRPVINFNSSRQPTVSWNGVTDSMCAGGVQYWSQLSTTSTFNTVWPATWINGWRNPTTQGTLTSCNPGQTLYARVRSRDSLDNQSGWSPTATAICPSAQCMPNTISVAPIEPLGGLGWQTDDVTFDVEVDNITGNCFMYINGTNVDANLSTGTPPHCNMTWTPGSIGGEGDHLWEIRTSTNAFTAQTACVGGSYCVDGTAPAIPGNRQLTCTQTGPGQYRLDYSHDPLSADNGCAGLNPSTYRAQLSTSNGFGSFLPGSNVWKGGTTTSSTVTPASPTTYYGRVQARDNATNQSVSGVSQIQVPGGCALLPCTLAAPTATFSCRQDPGSGLFEATVDWDPLSCSSVPDPYIATITTASNTYTTGRTADTGPFSAPSDLPEGTVVSATVSATDGTDTETTTLPSRTMNCSNCTCAAATPVPPSIGGMLRYCPQP